MYVRKSKPLSFQGPQIGPRSLNMYGLTVLTRCGFAALTILSEKYSCSLSFHAGSATGRGRRNVSCNKTSIGKHCIECLTTGRKLFILSNVMTHKQLLTLKYKHTIPPLVTAFFVTGMSSDHVKGNEILPFLGYTANLTCILICNIPLWTLLWNRFLLYDITFPLPNPGLLNLTRVFDYCLSFSACFGGKIARSMQWIFLFQKPNPRLKEYADMQRMLDKKVWQAV